MMAQGFQNHAENKFSNRSPVWIPVETDNPVVMVWGLRLLKKSYNSMGDTFVSINHRWGGAGFQLYIN
jgi:hypothetical protein